SRARAFTATLESTAARSTSKAGRGTDQAASQLSAYTAGVNGDVSRTNGRLSLRKGEREGESLFSASEVRPLTFILSPFGMRGEAGRSHENVCTPLLLNRRVRSTPESTNSKPTVLLAR